jgi:hypothetical protein
MIIDLMSDSGHIVDSTSFVCLPAAIAPARWILPKGAGLALGRIDRRNQESPNRICDLAHVAPVRLHSYPRQLWHSRKFKLNRASRPRCAWGENGRLAVRRSCTPSKLDIER